MSIARSKSFVKLGHRSKSLVADGPGGIYSVVIKSGADTSVLDKGGKLVEGTVGNVDTLAVAVFEVEIPLSFLDLDHGSINTLRLCGGEL